MSERERLIDQRLRSCFGAWDGYDYHGERRQHFSEAQREHWREKQRQALEQQEGRA